MILEDWLSGLFLMYGELVLSGTSALTELLITTLEYASKTNIEANVIFDFESNSTQIFPYGSNIW